LVADLKNNKQNFSLGKLTFLNRHFNIWCG